MNKIVNTFLLAGDTFVPEMYLRQPATLGNPGFTYNAYGLFTKNKERSQTYKEIGRFIIYLSK